MSVRTYLVADALNSYRDLTLSLKEFTLEELEYALELERDTQRRPSVMDRIIRRIVAIRSAQIRFELQRKYING